MITHNPYDDPSYDPTWDSPEIMQQIINQKAMTQAKQAVSDLCAEVYQFGFSQIVIDLVQDGVEEVLNQDEYPRRDQVGALAYHADLILEVMTPYKPDDISYLKRLTAALEAWSDDLEATSLTLGLPRES